MQQSCASMRAVSEVQLLLETTRLSRRIRGPLAGPLERGRGRGRAYEMAGVMGAPHGPGRDRELPCSLAQQEQAGSLDSSIQELPLDGP
jgi:hypothetical protein